MREVNQTELNCINKAVFIFIMWVNYCFDASNPCWERNPATASLHCICTVDVDAKLEDVVQDVC